MNNYVLYHADCMDGKGAALAAWMALGESAIYIPVQYKQPLPEMEDGKNVYIVDFSYSRDILESIRERSKSIVVLDHHKTAMDDLHDLPYAKFDMDKSGAAMAWEYFHPNKDVPPLIQMIQDRDLWKFNISDTRPASTALSLISDFKNYELYLNNYDDLVSTGTIKLGFDKETINKAEKKAVVGTWNGHRCAVINTTDLFSEIGERFYTKYNIDFVAMYFVSSSGELVFSFRSSVFDVGQFAKSIGGGGHPQAAGAKATLTEGAKILEEIYANAKPLKEFQLNS